MKKYIRIAIRTVLSAFPLSKPCIETSGTAAPITFRIWFFQKILGFNRRAYWPVSPTSRISDCDKIKIGIGTAPGLSPGCYIQGLNGIELGDYSLVGPNVCIVSASHSIFDYFEHEKCEPIRIGRYCWIGANSVVLPGVTLGDHTVVAAGAVVTESFPKGYCVVAGVPAKRIKSIDPVKVVERRNPHEYIGFKKVKCC